MKLLNDLFYIKERGEENGRTAFTITLNTGHMIFKEHFPGHPLMPGVASVRIVTELACVCSGRELMLKGVKSAKFITPINPEENPELLVLMNMEGDSVKAEVSCGGKTAVRLSLEY